MKKTIISILLFFAAIAAFAQNSTVKGLILDAQSHEGEPYAVVQILKDSKTAEVVAFTMTEESGAFTFHIPANGKYVLLFSNLGRKEVRKPFALNGENELDFGEILVEYDAETINAAGVVAQQNLVKMDVDKMTYKVSDDVDSKTSTVLDMLRKVPMVSVDGEDNITVNGSSNFQVFVDGKPNQMLSSNPSQIFKFMPASAIKTIDVVTNPGVKYDAEGVGGVLNLTTNKEVTGGQSVSDGQYGTVRAQVSTRGYGGGLFYNMQKGKFTLGLNGNVMINNMPGTDTDEERVQILPGGNTTTKTHSESQIKSPMIMGNLNLGYEFDDQNSISATAGIMHNGMDAPSFTDMTMTFADGTTAGYHGTSDMYSKRSSINASVDYGHTWADVPGRTLGVSYQFSTSPSVNNTNSLFGGASIPGFNLTDRKSEGSSKDMNNILQIDFSTPAGTNGTFSTGVKFTARHSEAISNNFVWNGSEFVPTAAGSMNYNFYNNIGAAYAEYQGTFGAIAIKGGIRYEQTWQKVTYAAGQGTDFNKNYGNLVPSASIQWNVTDTQNIGLSYSMRIRRPGITYLNPYVDISNPTSISYGNTDLTTEDTHNINLVYNVFTPKIMVNMSLRHSFSNDGISQYSFFDASNILNTTFGNIVKTSSTGLNAYVMWTPGKKTRVMLNGSASYMTLESATLNQSNGGWSYNAMVGFQQTLPLDLRLSANLITSGNRVTLQGTTDGISLAMVGLTKSFLDDKLSLSLNAVGSLKGLTSMTMSSYSEGPGFTSSSVNKVPMGQISFSISYSFGKQSMSMKMKKTSRRSSDDDIMNTQNLGETMNSAMSSF